MSLSVGIDAGLSFETQFYVGHAIESSNSRPRIMIYTGVDLIEIHRIAAVRDRYPVRFLNKVFTHGEQRYARNRAPQLASRFAAKEAVMKALGTGVRGIPWKSIEVTRRRGGPPEIMLHGNARVRANRMGVKRIALSLSHSKDFAVASVVLEATDDAWKP